MNHRTLKSITIAAVLCGTLTVSAYATSIGGATVNVEALNLRNEPTTNASVMATSLEGSYVVVGEKISNNWYKVVYKGKTGYMSSDFLNFSENLEGDFGVGKVFGTEVRLRDGASLNANVIGYLENGKSMQVIGVFGGWYKVKSGDKTGYVFSDYFSLRNSASEEEESLKGQEIVDTAMKYMGVPYVWGGTSESGFDCSGLVYYVYKECGYSIDRTAATIYEDGTYVDQSELQVGDAICFSSASNPIGHVGIYIGGGQFIHASSASGQVIISDLSNNYYASHYVGARRLV